MIFFTLQPLYLQELVSPLKDLCMTNVSKLREQHVELAVVASQLSEIIAHAVPPPSQEFHRVRTRLASALIKHLKCEDCIFYPSLLNSRNESIALTAKAFTASMGALGSEFKTYSERWDSDSILHNWTQYQSETFEILRSLTLRMTREESDLYPLLDAPLQAAA